MKITIELNDRDADRAESLAAWRGMPLDHFLIGAIQSDMSKQEKVWRRAKADQWAQNSC